MTGASFFDFDGTIVKGDTFITFGVFARGRCRFMLALARTAHLLAGWKLGLLSSSRAKEALFGALFKGMDMERFRRLGREFATVPRERPEGMELLRGRIAAGDEVWIVSASMAPWIIPWAGLHGIDPRHVLATEPEVDAHGCLTGRFATPNCLGPEKVRRIREAVAGFDSRTTHAYGDSCADLPMIAACDRGRLI